MTFLIGSRLTGLTYGKIPGFCMAENQLVKIVIILVLLVPIYIVPITLFS